MITERGKSRYPIPDDMGHLQSVIVDEREQCGFYQSIQIVLTDQMLALRKKYRGKFGYPTYAAVIESQLVLCPTPDGSFKVVARYLPVLKEF